MHCKVMDTMDMPNTVDHSFPKNKCANLCTFENIEGLSNVGIPITGSGWMGASAV